MNNNWKIYLLTIICFFTGTSEFIVVGILDEISKTTHITIPQAGQLTTVFALTSAMGTPIGTYCLRAFDQRKILIIALSLVITGSLLLTLTSIYELMIVSRVIMALGVGLFNVQCFLVATKLVVPEKKASAISTVTMGFNASLIFGLPMGRVITSISGWQMNFLLLAIFCLLAIIAVYRFIPVFETEKPKSFKKQFSLFKNQKLLLSMSISFFWILGYAVFYTFVTPFLQQVAFLENHLLSGTLFAYGIATLIGNKLGAISSEKFGFINIIKVSIALNAIAMVLLSLEKGMPVLSIVTLMLWSLAVWGSGPLLRYNILTLTDEDQGIVLSLYNSLVQLGVASGAAIGGIVITHLPIIFISYVSILAAIISFILVVNFSRGRKLSV